jgi:hypothetical protein
VNINPTLPSPIPAPEPKNSRSVGAVPAVPHARDTADPATRQDPPRRVSQAEREAILGDGATVYRQADTGSRRASRALAAYSAVAEQPQRNDLREMLGFDAYA